MPPIGAILGGVDFSHLSITVKEAVDGKPAVVMAYGKFLLAVLDFLIIASVIFAAVKIINTLKRKEEAAPAPAPGPSKEELLLAEIRDLLKGQNQVRQLDDYSKSGQSISSYDGK